MSRQKLRNGKKKWSWQRSAAAAKKGFAFEKGGPYYQESAKRSDDEGGKLSEWVFDSVTMELTEVFSWEEDLWPSLKVPWKWTPENASSS